MTSMERPSSAIGGPTVAPKEVVLPGRVGPGEARAASERRIRVVWGLLGITTVTVFLLCLAIGSVPIPFSQVLRILSGGAAERPAWAEILWQFRLPRALTAGLAGAALAVSGVQMQTLFRNPLADPFILGINAGAGLGVALVVLGAGSGTSTLLAGYGLAGDLGLVAAGALGAALVLMAVLVVARQVRHPMTLLIVGLMVSYLTGSLVSILLYFSRAERLRSYLAWTFGSFGGVSWQEMQVLGPVVLIGLLLVGISTKALNALLLGEEYAESLGLAVRPARFRLLLSASLLAGAVTTFCGPIGFLGVAVPHLARALLATADHRLILPSVTLLGATLAMLADLVSQAPGSGVVLPLNAVTALLGAPVVLWAILGRRRAWAGEGG